MIEMLWDMDHTHLLFWTDDFTRYRCVTIGACDSKAHQHWYRLLSAHNYEIGNIYTQDDVILFQYNRSK